MKMLGENEQPYSLREEFINHFPRKTIEDLQLMEEDGCFICLATVGGIVKNEIWWFRLRLDVGDITERAEFIVFDYDAFFLLSKTCASMVGDAIVYEFNMLIGKELLFKVEVKEDQEFKWDDSFKVKKVCSDESIIREFKEDSSVKTPEKSMFKTSLTEVPGEGSAADASAGSSNVAMCLAPQKRKGAPRGDRAAASKKKALGRPVKIEKE
ncbi:hypothetical protein SESBI_20606 [Sesbania bispinosa]|nr:hypothetical protein SESBI_20606 [Sesbania bispinosa]